MAHRASLSKLLFRRPLGVAVSLAATTAWGANYAPFIVPAGTTFTLNGGDSVTGTGTGSAIRVGNATLNFGPGNIAIGNVDLGVFATNGAAANINFQSGTNVTITTVTTTGLGLQSTTNSQATFALAPSSNVTIRGFQGVNLGHTPFGTMSRLQIGDGATLKIETAPAGGNPWPKGVMTSNNTAITLDAGGVLDVQTTGGTYGRGVELGYSLTYPDSVERRFTSAPGSALRVSTTGQTSDGFYMLGVGEAVMQGATDIHTTGRDSSGMFLRRYVSPINHLVVAPQGGSTARILTEGADAYGVIGMDGSRAELSDLKTETRGTDAVGLYAYTSGGQPATVFQAARNTVVTSGQGGFGILAQGAASSVVFDGGSVQTSGSEAHGVVVAGTSSFAATDSVIGVSGARSVGLLLTSDTGTQAAVINGGSIVSATGTAIGVDGGVANIQLDGTTVQGATNWLQVASSGTLLGSRTRTLHGIDPSLAPDAGNPGGINVTGVQAGSPATANVSARNATLTGAAITEAGSTSNVTLVDSTWTLTGNSTITNLVNDPSLIDFAPPQAGAYKTLTVRNYSGDGTIALNTYLGDDSSPSDKLVVNGGSASGASQLRIKNTGGPGALTTASGIQVVQVVNGGISGSGAFALAGRVVAGPYEYRLYQGSTSAPADQSWYLRSEKQPEPPPPPPPDPPAPPVPPTPPDPEPLYRPEVAAYLANQRLVGQMFVQSMHDRLGEPQFIEGQQFQSEDSKRRALWLRAVGKWEGSHSRDGNFDVSTDMFLLQGGGDVAQWKLFSETDRLHLGLMLGYGSADSTARADGNPYKARGRVQGYSGGVYGTWFQNDESKLGAYVDTWFQYGWYNNRVTGDDLPRVDYDSRAWAVSAETGYAFKLRGDWILEPQAQIIYVSSDTDSLTESNGTRVGSADSHGTITRLGVRTHTTFDLGNGRKAQPFATLNWWHSSTGSSVSFNQLPVGDLYPKDRYELKLGVHADFNKGWTGWTNIAGSWGAQDYHQYAARIGVKYTW
ncbi:autotransporter outer membrane beta-barrel domain-containing protein [Achromobacter aegrifaciens]|uniref:autotransporter family protein n=1 Tax=Achromobacter aegrifaciens TaxID=1287736 RepID=UPI0027BA55D5|nr:autotransporter outer membrane beta-barrel domain-containing protein [Achromobacter aegrifaciens]WLW64682.1 autotransporter outer membrane beta-barrel domain-containing protein [Achromobacter aegrifaciens]